MDTRPRISSAKLRDGLRIPILNDDNTIADENVNHKDHEVGNFKASLKAFLRNKLRDPDAVQRYNIMDRIPEFELGTIINDPNIIFNTRHPHLFVQAMEKLKSEKPKTY